MHPQDLHGTQQGAYIAMPPGGIEPLIEDPRMAALAQQRAANRAKAAAFGVAVLVHALIGLLLAWIVLSASTKNHPN